MEFWRALSERIAVAACGPFLARTHQAIGGGCINDAYRVQDGERVYFVKLNAARYLPMFEAEAGGLAEILDSDTLRVPRPICHGNIGDRCYLVLEYIPLARTSETAMESLGRELALMHRTPRPYFGWHRDNTIGSTVQINERSEDWTTFWRDDRLGFQLGLAARNGYGGSLQKKGERLLIRIDALLRDHGPSPALLHGDLWSGNVACDGRDRAVVFDPAVYYGDRETDLAMTELFGGFSARFYSAYEEAYPLESGYRMRRTLYNLYHILNHLNLFGRGYLSQAERMIDALLAELG